MVQLQTDSKELEAAGIRVIAISYDSVEVLAKFASDKKIAFPLLSDNDSLVIKSFGILNKEASGRTAGIPYPGTYLIDSMGVIRAKLFLDGYKQRHATDALIEAAAELKK
ncbi:MAG: redoxin domain-containing protein [Planctomycetota bacterium]|nr:redoxin domain-containing protein [Planctomycetota bacterium]